ncbi:carboxypeptidase regulatory-like domain-containing protein [Burkholderia multivorans]|uniref:carboxypeptidase regulatory-like domain-containing protein n=3 Tax=Burkholderia TaxID=32008 RepID=UPI00358E650C
MRLLSVAARTLDLSQRETGVRRDAGVAVRTHARCRVLRPPRDPAAAWYGFVCNRENEMAMRMTGWLLSAAWFLSVGAGAFAQSPPEPATQNGVEYVTGGIGADEAATFRDAARRYNLRLTFVSKAGEYLSDVDVTIAAGSRQVLTVRTAGPFLYVRVPAGRYTISARDRRVHETRPVTVAPRRGADVRFIWDDPERHGVMRLCKPCS